MRWVVEVTWFLLKRQRRTCVVCRKPVRMNQVYDFGATYTLCYGCHEAAA